MKKLLSIIISITILFSLTISAFADETFVSSGTREVEGIIKVGVNAEFPPFEYMEKDKLLGFDIDLMNCIGARIGYGIEFVNMPFDALIPSVVNGEVDCAISAITVTEERKKVVDFSEIYLDTYEQIDETSSQIVNYAIVFPGNSSEKEKVIEASGKKINVLIYTLVNNAIKELKNDTTIEKLLEKYDIPKANYVHGPGWPEEKAAIGVVTNDNALSDGTPLAPPSDWAMADVDKAKALGIINDDVLYRYRMSITREEFCELIYDFIFKYTQLDLPWVTTVPLGDTSNEKIRSLYCWGIINGKGTFTQEPVISPEGVVKRYPTISYIAPKDYLTREEAAAIIIRMINKFFPMAATEMWFEYDDMAEISDWAVDSVQTISNLGFMSSVGNNKFAPKDTYTTEQAIATIVRVYAVQSLNTEIIDE